VGCVSGTYDRWNWSLCHSYGIVGRRLVGRVRETDFKRLWLVASFQRGNDPSSGPAAAPVLNARQIGTRWHRGSVGRVPTLVRCFDRTNVPVVAPRVMVLTNRFDGDGGGGHLAGEPQVARRLCRCTAFPSPIANVSGVEIWSFVVLTLSASGIVGAMLISVR